MSWERTLTKVEMFEFTKVGQKVRLVMVMIFWLMIGIITGFIFRAL